MGNTSTIETRATTSTDTPGTQDHCAPEQTAHSSSHSTEDQGPNNTEAAQTAGLTSENQDDNLSDQQQEHAARALQHHWRARTAHANPSARWHEMDIQMRYKVRVCAYYHYRRQISPYIFHYPD